MLLCRKESLENSVLQESERFSHGESFIPTCLAHNFPNENLYKSLSSCSVRTILVICTEANMFSVAVCCLCCTKKCINAHEFQHRYLHTKPTHTACNAQISPTKRKINQIVRNELSFENLFSLFRQL